MNGITGSKRDSTPNTYLVFTFNALSKTKMKIKRISDLKYLTRIKKRLRQQ